MAQVVVGKSNVSYRRAYLNPLLSLDQLIKSTRQALRFRFRLWAKAGRSQEASAASCASKKTYEQPRARKITLEQARLLTLNAAQLMDTAGNKAARGEIAMIKVVVPRAALRVIDRAIQAHGAAGVSEDFPLASAWAHTRTIRLADGPDEVHRDAIAKLELRKYQ